MSEHEASSGEPSSGGVYEPYRPGGEPAPGLYGGPPDQPDPPIPSGLYGGPQGHVVSLPTPSTVDRLVEAPRAVPFSYRLASLQFGVVQMFVLFMCTICPMALWILMPTIRTVALFGLTAALVVRAVLVYRNRVSLLRVGEVATVTAVHDEVTNTSFTNVPLRRAYGWSSKASAYTGPGHKIRLSYTIAGATGDVVVRGAPYGGGVVLADPRRPERAVCVSQLPFEAAPGPDGRFTGRLTPWVWIGTFLTLDFHLLFFVLSFFQLRALL